MNDMKDDAKALSQARFSQYAQRYVTSATHARGGELTRLLELAHPEPHFCVLDIATGGGHTALTFAPHVASVVAADISEKMLNAARDNHIAKDIENITYVTTDAEKLAFAPNSFDLVTCRIAPHHFPDCFRFVWECARVLKPGGRLLIQDHVLPEDPNAIAYIEAFERLRDPSHHRAFSVSEWRGMYLDAGLQVTHTEETRTRARLVPWAAIQDCPPRVVTHLQVLLHQAPDIARDFWRPSCVGTPDAEFDHVYIVILGTKPDE